MIPYLIDKNFDLVKLYESGNLPMFDADNKQIYVRDPNPILPTSNGIGVLADISEGTAKHVLNGQDEITIKYPIDGSLYDKLELRAIIMAKVDRVRGIQPYRIYRITKAIKGFVTIYARHIAYDLSGIVVSPYSSNNISDALSGLRTNSMTSCPFRFSTTRTTEADFYVDVPTPIWDLLGGHEGSLLDVYGGEYSFNGFNISLENRVGQDRGVSVRYGVNMTDFEQDTNCANCYTGVVAYWAGEEGVIWSDIISTAGNYDYTKVMTLDLSYEIDGMPSKQALNEIAAAYIQTYNIGIPDVSWDVNFVPLDQTLEYKDIAPLEAVSLGDTVKIIFEKLNVNATARVSSVSWDILNDRYLSVELGSVKNSLANTIATQTKEIAAVPTADDVSKIASVVASGIVAEWIKTGKISADRIEGGTLQLGKELNESGRIDIFNAANEYIGALYNAGMWWGSGIYSSLQNQNGFSIRKRYSDDGSTQNLVFIGRTTRDETTGMDYGILHMASVDDSGNRVINSYINGDGTISCKRLFVNGHEIT